MKKKTDAYIYKFKHDNKFPDKVSVESLDREINEKVAIIAKYEQDLSTGAKGDFTGVAFVSLKTEAMKQELIKRNKVSSWTRFKVAFFGGSTDKGLSLNNQRLYVSQAAEPGDVYWDNLHYTDKQLYLKKLFGVIFTLILLALCGILIFYLTYEQNILNGNSRATTSSSSNSTAANATNSITASNSTTASNASATNDTVNLIELPHFLPVKHMDSTENNSTTSSDNSTTSNSSGNATEDNSTNATSSNSSNATSSESSTSSSTESKIIAYSLALCVTIINKVLCFVIPFIAR